MILIKSSKLKHRAGNTRDMVGADEYQDETFGSGAGGIFFFCRNGMVPA